MCCDMPVSGVETLKSMMVREINHAANEVCSLCLFMDDTYLGPVERRNEFINDLYRDYKEHTLQLNNLRKKIKNQGKKATQRLEDLGRIVHLASTVRRSKQTLMHMSAINKGHRRRRVKVPLPRNSRQIIEDNLCQAVQGMQLNSENFVSKSECMQSGDKFLSKLDGPSEVAEDLSKLCMKD